KRDWSSDVCSSDLSSRAAARLRSTRPRREFSFRCIDGNCRCWCAASRGHPRAMPRDGGSRYLLPRSARSTHGSARAVGWLQLLNSTQKGLTREFRGQPFFLTAGDVIDDNDVDFTLAQRIQK